MAIASPRAPEAGTMPRMEPEGFIPVLSHRPGQA